jgi:Xaa-Pro aminopeptidase
MSDRGRRRAAVGRAVDADALLVTDLVNVRYLTGFTGSNAAALLRPDGTTILATDGRYAVQAADEAPDVEILVTRSVTTDLVMSAVSTDVRTLAVERHVLTAEMHDRLAALDGRVELTDAGHAVEQQRIVKDDDEIRALRAACQITDAAFDAVLPKLQPGVTELDISWELRAAMHAHGAEPAFDSIVAFGANSARPHHSPTGRELAPGDLVKLDFGAEVDGYHADMTRTVAVGPVADWQRELHQLVRQVQADARAATVAGAVPVDVDTLARELIEAAGYEPAHGLGHGVGLQIHELPFLVPGSTAARLVERVPVTVEPGVYLPGRGGVRIEDTVLVGAAGAEPLTRSTRDLLVL